MDQSDGETSFWSAPAPFLGDKSVALGGALRFDLRQNSTSSQYNTEDLILSGGGLLLYSDLFSHPGTTWTRFYVALAPGTWRLGAPAGPFASSAEILQVLSNLDAIYIRAEYRSGADTDGLDNVRITEADPCPYSYFDASSENWTTVGDTTNVMWSDTMGNPPGSFGAVDLVQGILWEYVAPGKFLGDRSAFFGSTLSFDLYTNRVDAEHAGQIVSMRGSGLTLQYEAPMLPVEDQWTRYDIPLEPSEFWTRGDTGDPVTPQEFNAVLSGLSRISIRGEYWSGDDTGFIDNVHFGDCGPCIRPGDLDRSNTIDAADLMILAAVLVENDTDAEHIECADLNNDNVIDGLDIAPMVSLLLCE
ncbi:MAG: hypothetical protein H6819_05465 [Phycisphaerales bacterium]|nr:hypothetical protein [Phycisphaerales bacterium]MCB9854772.1 hypothetical protein [Phycisphaerales bacterium]MCB9863756.1 hypothetical protein [Phycisphaerales bacterium]